MAKPIKIQIIGDASKFSKAVDTANSKMGTLAKVGGAAFAGLGAGAVAGLGAGISASIDFDQNMREVFTLLPGISQGAMDEMKDQLLDLGTEFGAMSSETVPALYDSLSAGVPADNVFEFLETAQKFATAGATDVSTAVDGLSTVVNAFGLEAGDAGAAADVMFAAVKAGKTTVPELSGAMFQIAPIAAAMGVELDTVAAGFATLTAQGVPTSVAATQMKSALGELGKEGTKADKAFRSITDVGFADFIAAGGTTEEALNMLAASAEESGISVLDMFGSIEAGQGVLGLTGDQADSFAANIANAGDAAGGVEEAFEVMDEGIGATWDKIKAGTNQAFIEIGDAVAPFVGGIADKFAAFVPKIAMFFSALSTGFTEDEGTPVELFALKIRDFLIPVITNVSNFITGTLIPALKRFGDFVVSDVVPVIGRIAGFIRSDVVPALKQFAGFVVSDVVPVLVRIAGFITDDVVPALQSVAQWVRDEIVPRFQELATQIADNLGPTIQALSDYWENALKPALIAVAEVIRDYVAPFLGKVADIIIEKVVPFVLTHLVPAMIKISEIMLGTVIPALVKFVGYIIEKVVPFVGKFIDKIGELIGKAVDMKNEVVDNFESIVDTITGLPSRISSAASGMWDGIRDAFRNALNWIIDKWNGLSFTLPSVSVFGQTIGGGSIGTPNIARFAYGTNYASGGRALVGEHGPELVTLPRGSSVTPNHAMNGNGGGITVNVMEPGATADQIAYQLGWAMRTGGVS